MKRTFILLLSALVMTVSCEKSINTDIHVSHQDNVKADTLRVISYNVLEGMKLDAENGYENFIKWVKEYNPDVLAIEEANGLTKEKLSTLASKWGHSYVESNCGYPGASTYPVAITSRYEMKDVEHLVGDVYHGGIHTKIKDIHFTVLHLYPFGDIRSNIDWSKPKDEDSDGDIDGDDYRIHEIQEYMNRTIKKNPRERLWLMMGDFNSYSPLDAAHYNSKESYDVHKLTLEVYHDLIKEMNKDFCRSTPTIWGGWNESRTDGSRIDYLYGSQAVVPEIVSANIIYDEFTEQHSDHYPILLDMRIYENGKN